MANKAKVAVLSLLTLTSLAVVSLAAVVSSKGFDSLGNNPSVKPSLLTEHDGAVYTEAVVNNRATIDIKIQNAYIDEGVAKVDGNNYYVISNEAGEDNAIRGIRSISYTWTNSSIITESESVGYAVYYSYNHLTVEDIFAGKYTDMKRIFDQRSVIGESVELSTEYLDINGAACRYFLIIIESPSVEITLDDFSVDAYCSAEPSPKEIGEWTSYPEGMIDALGGITEFPFVGNGSWLFENNYSGQAELVFFQQKSTYNISWFENTLETNGFIDVYYIPAAQATYWQKPSSGDLYYTYMVRSQEHQDFLMVDIMYLGVAQSMESVPSWPSDKIDEALTSSAFKSQIYNPELVGEVSYVNQAETSDYKHEISIGAMVDNNESHLATNRNKTKAYLNKFVNEYGFEKQYENDSSYYYRALAISSDLQYYVLAMFDPSSNMAIFTFDEYYYGTFPTDAINSKFDSKFPTFASSEGSFCLITTSSNNYNVQAKGVTAAEINTYLSTLSGLGFEVYDGSAHLSATSSSGLPVRYTFQTYSSYFGSYNLQFSVYEPDSYNDFSKALSATHLSSGLAYNIAINSGLSSGEFYVSEGQTVYCKNWGSDEYAAITAAYVESYNEFLDGYLISSGSGGKGDYYVIRGSVQGNFLVLDISSLYSEDYSIITNLVGKSDINTVIDNWGSGWSIADVSSFHVVRNSVCYYPQFSSNIKVCAKDAATINSIRDEYINSLTSNTNIKHSSFNDYYYNENNNTAVKVSRAVNSGAYYYYTIKLYANTTYKDYFDASTFSSSISKFAYMSAFPSPIKDSGEHYLLDLDEKEYLEFYVDDTVYSAYLSDIQTSTTFSRVETNVYRYVDSSNNLYLIQANCFEGIGHFRFEVRPNYYLTMAEIQTKYSKSSFFSNFMVPQDTAAVFHVNDLGDTDATIEVDPYRFDFDAYKTLLISNGYDFELANNKFTKTTSDSVTIISYSGSYLNFTKATFNKLSYVDFVSAVESRGFESARLDNFVTTEAMENNYCLDDAYKTSFSVVIANSSFTISDYRKALLTAGYNETYDDHFEKGTSYVSLSTYFGYVRIYYQDIRLILYSWSEIETQIKNTGYFPEWKLDEIVKPNQSGKMFTLNYQYGNYFSVNFSSDFDVDAYVNRLQTAGYNLYDYEADQYYYFSYEGGINIYIRCYDNSISFSHNGQPKQYLTDEYVAEILDEYGFELSSNISVLSAWSGNEVLNFSVDVLDNTIYLRFAPKAEPPSDGQIHYSSFGNVYVEYEIVEGCYEIRIFDFAFAESTTLDVALWYIDFPIYTGVQDYNIISSYGVNIVGNYIRVSNAEDVLDDLYAYYQACVAEESIDGPVSRDGDIITINSYGEKFSIELIDNSTIKIGRINY